MVWTHDSDWHPTQLIDVINSVETSTEVTEVNTDAGRAFIKPMGNRQGPHVLATDWVGTHLARWFGLSTFDIAILKLEEDDQFELPSKSVAQPGPAFAARAMSGDPWGNSKPQLDLLENPEDITRLIIFDTWTLNCDRHDGKPGGRKPNPDNVFMSRENAAPGKRRLIAMDHGLCFIRSNEDLSRRLNQIGTVQESNVYGLFPAFIGKIRERTIEDCTTRLRQMDVTTASEIIETVPREWDVPGEVRAAWAELITQRAAFVADNVQKWIDEQTPWFGSRGT